MMNIDWTLEAFRNGQMMLFNKPYTWTSFNLVNRVRYDLCKHYGIKKLKVGHAGTLDPLATGLMILCTGKATKQLTSLTGQDKEYIAEIALGATTPSSDLETEIDQHFPTEHITLQHIHDILPAFTGRILQEPPLFSAKSINGIRAYQLARNGSDKKLDPVEVHINELEVLSFNNEILTLRIHCSKGTYIRSIARDIGKALGSGAHLKNLIRTRSGNFLLTNAFEYENFKEKLANSET